MKLTRAWKVLLATAGILGVLTTTPMWIMVRGVGGRAMEYVRSGRSVDQIKAEIEVALRDMDAEFPRHAGRLADLEADVEKTRLSIAAQERALREERLNLAGDRELLHKDGDRFEVGKGRFYSRGEIEADARTRSPGAQLRG